MVKKSLIIGLTAIILSLCCGMCFAAENNSNTSTNLGNEITQSIDKTGQSMGNMTDNVFSTNTADNMRNGMNNVTGGITNTMNNMRNTVTNGMNDTKNGVRDGMNTADNGIVNATDGQNNGNYNATRTTAEATTGNFTSMSTTTWMWIILAVAAIIIIAAIWYYATQNNEQ